MIIILVMGWKIVLNNICQLCRTNWKKHARNATRWKTTFQNVIAAISDCKLKKWKTVNVRYRLNYSRSIFPDISSQVWKGIASNTFNPDLICFLLISIRCANIVCKPFQSKVTCREHQQPLTWASDSRSDKTVKRLSLVAQATLKYNQNSNSKLRFKKFERANLIEKLHLDFFFG